MTLIEFLTARLDEEHRAAEAAAEATGFTSPGRWTSTPCVVNHGGWQVADGPAPVIREDDGGLPKALTDFIAAHDPTRALAEVAAKRAILRLHDSCGSGCGYCDDGGHGGAGPDMDLPGCPTTTLLAQPYRDRAGWDEAWEVEG